MYSVETESRQIEMDCAELMYSIIGNAVEFDSACVAVEVAAFFVVACVSEKGDARVPGHGKGRRFDRNANDALACSHMTDIDQKVLRAGSQHAAVVTEAQRTDRPFQSMLN